MKYDSILDTIGKTPHIRLSRLFPNNEVWIKLERQNPGGSIKDRTALAMIEDAEQKGLLKKGGTIIEPTSGNTGIGLSLIAAVKGYRTIITMPESMSIERRKNMRAYGAEVILTPRELGMKGAIEKAYELTQDIEGAWMPQQFENEANVKVHYEVTAQEIISDFPEGFDYFVSGVGTGGHITGIGQALKEKFPTIKIIAVEPDLSPVLNGGKANSHPIQGIGAGFIPPILKTNIIDKVLDINKQEAFDFAQKMAQIEGIFVGISTGASLAAIDKLLHTLDSDCKILTVNYDTGDRYLSVNGLY